tara:strand:+ start:16764 stop:17030 length:267 start_codon:yes stop_codon:yes gene_type:complete
MTKTKIMTFRISEPVHQMLRAASKEKGLTMSSYIEESLKRHIGSVADDLKTDAAEQVTINFQGGTITFPKAIKIPNKGILILDPKLAK